MPAGPGAAALAGLTPGVVMTTRKERFSLFRAKPIDKVPGQSPAASEVRAGHPGNHDCNQGCLFQVGNDIELARDTVGRQFEPYRCRPGGVTCQSAGWDVVPEPSWY